MDVEATLVDLERRDVVGRIWRRDHTVWRPDPTEIANRLGWLDVADRMRGELPALQAFAQEVREAGIRQLVLLGMGGSSLGTEVLRQTFGSAAGYPDLVVLDSTIPECVKAVTEIVDPPHTLFLVSSKSGTTLEVASLYKHFRQVVAETVSESRAGRHFVAITDPGTPLERLGKESDFRRVFLNPPDIGGRYSVLSHFGLVPAALMGLDLETLVGSACSMRESCAPSVPVVDNPGARLGALIGGLALEGRDKLTLIASPSAGSIGLWVEQLIAESTGKEGKGITPVIGEPLAAATHYGPDRLFVYLRVEGDDNAASDAAVDLIGSTGQPVLKLELPHCYELGGEFFRWQLATAVAGAILGIHPFDQPNVEHAKQLTAHALAQYLTSGHLPQVDVRESVRSLLAKARPGDYLAIMVYLRQVPELDKALAELRYAIVRRYHIATTVGYGPRFLHSTGQLHKGGPPTGLYLQLTASHEEDVAIPGEPYTFGVLSEAQALADLQALSASKRRVARARLYGDGAGAVRALIRDLA